MRKRIRDILFRDVVFFAVIVFGLLAMVGFLLFAIDKFYQAYQTIV